MRTTVLDQMAKKQEKLERVQQLKASIEGEDIPPERTREIAKLEEEIQLHEERIREYDGKFRSQMERVKQTIDKMLNEDTTLGERIRTLFREQGLTIASILTAIGLTISTIISSIVAAVRPTPAAPKPGPKPDPSPRPTPDPKPDPSPKPRPGSKEWIKAQLKKLSDLLLKLGDKMLIALPGIIGSVVNFLLKTASQVVGFVAEHVWILIVAVAGLLYNYITSTYTKKSQ